jgi:hypothetical protein
MSFEMTIAEWIGTAVILAVPYLVIGALWSLIHSGDIAHIVFWPVLLLSTVCRA